MSAPTSLQTNSVQYYLNLIGDIPRLTKEDEVYLSKMALAGDKLARSELVRGNLKLVVHVAKKHIGRGLPLLDLIQEGNLGLIRSTKDFDGSKGFKFSTYAYHWIERFITRGIEEKARTIRIPVHMHDYIRKITSATNYFEEQNLRQPTNEELIELTGLPKQKIERVLKYTKQPLSLDTEITIDDNGNVKIEGMLSDNAHHEIDNKIIQREIKDVLKKNLTKREEKIVTLRYGIGTGNPHTLEYIGNTVNLTRERIRQIIVHALTKLKHNSKCLALIYGKHDNGTEHEVRFICNEYDPYTPKKIESMVQPVRVVHPEARRLRKTRYYSCPYCKTKWVEDKREYVVTPQ